MQTTVLEAAWGHREGYIIISTKDHPTGQWRDHAFRWPQDRKKVIRFIMQHEDEADIYFAPAMFSEPQRREEFVKPVSVLWADLDTAPPSKCIVRPSVAWESSPNRYQALWLLDEELSPEVAKQLNKRMTYANAAIGADKSGWDLTQVLRIPGTTNFKYVERPTVRLLWAKATTFSPEELDEILPELPHVDTLTDIEALSSETEDLRELVWPYRKVLGERLWQLLFTPATEIHEGERSDRLWELECRLLEAGVPVSEVMRIVKACPWNKFAGRRDENKRILTEVLKAERQIRQGAFIASDLVVPWIDYSQLMGRTITGPGWLIRDIWVNNSWGFIAGEPKTYKSLIAMEIAVSVASGHPMWDQFPVDKTGPVLMIQEENAPWVVRDRLVKIASAKGLLDTRVYKPHPRAEELIIEFPPSLPIRMLNNWGFDLTIQEHQEMLEREVQKLQPALVILDPLYLMIGSRDINSMQELNDLLKWMLKLCTDNHVALIVLHHLNKGKDKPGGRLLGSTSLYGWFDSALYTIERDRTRHEITLERHFRSYGQSEPLIVKVQMSDPGEEPRYEITVKKDLTLTPRKERDEILKFLTTQGVATVAELIAATGYSSPGIKRALRKYIEQGYVTLVRKGVPGAPYNASVYAITEPGRQVASQLMAKGVEIEDDEP